MRPFFTRHFGNPSSLHRPGREARAAIDRARRQVADLIHADEREITFTSGGTEANHLAIRGASSASNRAGRKRVILSAIEHESALAAASCCEAMGVECVRAPVDASGRVIVGKVLEQIDAATVLVSIMHANNETGVIQSIHEIASFCREHNVAVHVDAIQSAGKIPVHVGNLPVQLISLSAHKIYGPKGAGALFVRDTFRFSPLFPGGPQERGRRGGTENVPAIVGFGAACELAAAEMSSRTSERITELRVRFEKNLLAAIPGSWVNGSTAPRLPNIANIGFPGMDAETLVFALDAAGIAASAGAACSSGSLDPSHVLLAMGQDHTRAGSAVRFSLGRETSSDEIEQVCVAIPKLVDSLSKTKD